MCALDPVQMHPDTAPPRRRRRLRDIDSSYHCSIVGTCLSLAELKRIARKTRVSLDPRASDYAWHGYFVKQAGADSAASRFMTKLLDRKYHVAIRQSARIEATADLRAWWREELEDGNVPGPFWALATHPASTPDLLVEVFAEVHMLSHLAGAANRADLRRLRLIEQAADEAGQRHLRMAERHRAAIAGRDAELERLKAACTDLEHRLARRQTLAEQAACTCDPDTLERHWSGQVAHLERALADTRASLDTVEELRASAERRAAELSDRIAKAEAERDTLEAMLGRRLDDRLAGFDLGARRVALVGGRPTAVARLRAMVERYNGRWMHHDGGEEDALAQLGSFLSGCDAVICPVDCVSHRACLEAKSICKRTSRPFLPIRGTGLATFAGALRELALTARADSVDGFAGADRTLGT
ncbi:MAG: DUF2325 domain-containing protein [Pseudomonadota bacterium]|nr:DUF2325 domain-containing protein [Pseudomonadota bacterium]